MQVDTQKLGTLLRNMREEKGFTIREIAMQCRLHDGSITRIEHGAQLIRASTLVRLLEMYGASIDDVFEELGIWKGGEERVR